MDHIYMEKNQYIKENFEKIGLSLDEKQIGQFLNYSEMLVEWNQKINLTAITDFEDIVWKHFIDSVSVNLSKIVSRETWNKKIIDVGTGAGFPSIPLKIVYPEGKYTLLDSLNKRIGFLQEVIKSDGLKNVTPVHGRAEDFGHDPKYREQYDVCISRAVSNLSTLSEYCIPFLRKGGIFIAYKSADSDTEIAEASKAIKVFGGEMIGVEKFVLPGKEIGRSLVVIKKVTNTPKKYPRKAGMPSKSPIR